MRRRLYELAGVAMMYWIDPDIMLMIWIAEMTWWYWGINRQTVKSNGF